MVDQTAKTITRQQLKEGEGAVAGFFFSPEWCEQFFAISGDLNADLHAGDGLRIVQGTAIITALSRVFSQFFPDFALGGFDAFYPKAPVYIGDRITIQVRRLDGRERLTKVELLIFRGGDELLRTIVPMVNKKYLKSRV